ncbi:nucleoside kinase [Leadbettera azotonutricia]|uniref:Phosphoribulokinase/uridine kinase family protein n=1 Tax=Leadbettera azotonutricia (strain ATCC BAA-888 / DSM 13862 / ZAS-9) TaxID=545695 RepID=F5Y8Z7_LEAAZ|nr:nucleoside kinase [Leadbettera azotonutricia]AEF81628.1 phosphoribulokinase/uridine kinase family protein [Leadbettera azotonutricia ZAS-9]
MQDLEIRIRSSGSDDKIISCPYGVPVEDLVSQFGVLSGPLVAVKANNEILPLRARLETNAVLEPVLLEENEGVALYRRSLAFLLAVAARELFPERSLYVGHSLGHSFYYTFNEGKQPGIDEVKNLENRMKDLAKEDLPISCHYMAYADALEHFRNKRQNDTALLLEGRNESKVMVNQCKDFIDLYIAPLVPGTGLLKAFELMAYQEGFLLRFPATGEGSRIEPFEDSPKIFNVYNEYKKWGRIVGVHSVGQLNRLIAERGIREYIRIAEAFQEKKLAEIADRIYERKDIVRAVLIAGPSSSGKTTTAKRLSIALKVMGIEPIAISLDDYYVGTDKTPLDEKGEPDYECLEALDIPYLNEQLLACLAGEEITLPVFDFKSGRRKETGGRKIRLGRRTMLVIEGIHGLNDALTPQIKRETKFKLYVSALTQLNLDDHNRIPTSDNRLIRRMVRDNQFRGAGAERTFQMWHSVQRGEKKHIFPFQNHADAAFNSALDYELAVLKFYAEPLLHSVKPGQKEYSEAMRLLSFLENFTPIPPQYVPGQSILREFIGDSEFKY